MNQRATTARGELPSFDSRPLIAEVDEALLSLLGSLEAADWEKTAVKSWRVRHVAAHLLDTGLRRLSLDRDGWVVADGPQIASYEDLVSWLDELNAEWTVATERLSPTVLVDLVAAANAAVADYFASLKLDAAAAFPVAWAGEARSQVWMDLARELTEKWLHQQQIRDAVERPGLTEARFVAPILDTFARALPRSYDAVEAGSGTTVLVEIEDLEVCRWLLARGKAGWDLWRAGSDERPEASIQLAADTAWRLFTKGLDREQASGRATLAGPEELTAPFFSTLAIMG